MSLAVGPGAPVRTLEPWIAARLHPLADEDQATRRPRSDFDLDPHTAPFRSADPLHRAAVLIPLVERQAGLTVLLTRRADTLSRHSGQIAFPGGRAEPGEAPWRTALREAHEEIGLDPAFVRVAGLADPYETVTGFSVVPVIGFLRSGFELRLHEGEVAEVFETPFAFLMDPANHERHVHDAPNGLRRHYYAMAHDGRFIWGATAGMLRALYERLFGEAAEAA